MGGEEWQQKKRQEQKNWGKCETLTIKVSGVWKNKWRSIHDGSLIRPEDRLLKKREEEPS